MPALRKNEMEENKNQSSTDVGSNPQVPNSIPNPTPPSSPVKSSGLKTVIAVLCFLLAIPQIIIPLILMIFVIPGLHSLYSQLSIKPNFSLVYVIPTITILLGMLGIFLGVKLLKNAKYVKFAIMYLVISFIFQGISVANTITSVINPIYMVTSQINNDQTTSPTLAPKTNPTASPDSIGAGWKTFESLEGKYLLKYPTDYTLHVNEVHIFETNGYSPTPNTVELDSPDAGTIPYILIRFETLSSPTTLSQYISNDKTCLYIMENPGNTLSIDGQEARRYDTNCGISGYTKIYAIKGNIAYTITINGEVPDQNFLKNFLSTFTFAPLSASKSPDQGTSGIQGHMSLGPTCPVQSPGSSCEKDYQGTVIVKSADGIREITKFTSDESGNFKVSLPTGTYLLVPVTTTSYPNAKTQTVTVISEGYTRISILYDTGIR